MILPTKYLSSERSLIKIGADIIKFLNEPKTVSRLWEEVKHSSYSVIKYEWFVLALDFLYCIKAINFESDKVWRARNDSTTL